MSRHSNLEVIKSRARTRHARFPAPRRLFMSSWTFLYSLHSSINHPIVLLRCTTLRSNWHLQPNILLRERNDHRAYLLAERVVDERKREERETCCAVEIQRLYRDQLLALSAVACCRMLMRFKSQFIYNSHVPICVLCLKSFPQTLATS